MTRLLPVAGATALLLALPGLAAAQPVAGPPAADDELARFAALTAAARGVLAADAGRLWGARLDTVPWLGVAERRVALTADPRQPGYQPVGGLWLGALPASVSPANTAVAWAGRRWAMVVLPLPTDSAAAVRLLVHEAMHALQPAVLPAPAAGEGGAGAALLDAPAGRIWLRLEWAALARALERGGAASRAAAGDALLFRARRYLEADAGERRRQRALDVAEGLPEYTAWTLTAGTGAAAAVAGTIHAESRVMRSFVRGFPYLTGPAYALLLDRHAGAGWRQALGAEPDLQQRLADALPGVPDALRRSLGDGDAPPDAAATVRRLAERAGARYGLDTVRAGEERRWQERERQLAGLRARFVDGPTIRVRPGGGLSITFDPRGQTSLGTAGTVMANLVWKHEAGAELRAPDGALVSPDWQELRVPLGDATLAPGPLVAPLTLRGPGWTLALPAGWAVEAAGASWVVRPAGR